MKRPRWVCCSSLLTGVLWLALVACSGSRHIEQGVIQLNNAEFVASSAIDPPDALAPWRPQPLPDHWPTTRRDLDGYAWYRLHFEVTKPTQRQQAILISRLRTVGAVYVNGTLVGQSGDFESIDPVVRPQLFSFRPELLQTGVNTLHIRLWVGPSIWAGTVSPVRIGDQSLLIKEVERDRFVVVTVGQMACVYSAVIGLYMLFIWRLRRREEMFGYFGFAAVLTALWVGMALGHRFGLPDQIAVLVSGIGGALVPPLLFVFYLRFVGWRWRRVERALWVFAVLQSLICIGEMVYVSGFGGVSPSAFAYLWLVPAAATCLLTLAIVEHQRSTESALLALGNLYSVLVQFRSYLVSPFEAGDYLPTHLLPLYLIIGWILSRRFARSLDEAERLNAELEQRVADKHAELERNYGRMQQVERQSAISEERARIMSDMHDGIGAQLISTLSLVEHGAGSPGDVATALRECIDDLRLAIDSLEPADEELLPVLGNLRYRLEGRLKASGIDLDWQVAEVPKLACLTPQNVLHVLRILQEAFTNVLKHAQASRIRVVTAVDAGAVSISVSDNGRGFAAATAKGYGLGNMRSRARTIGGDLKVLPSPSGTTLLLLLPIG